MVGDLHFIVRHGLTGFVFMFFVIFGIWNAEIWIRKGCDIASYLQQSSATQQVYSTAQTGIALQDTLNCTSNKAVFLLKDLEWAVLIFATIIGISLQGAQMLIRYMRNDLFTDPARQAVANRVGEVISEGKIEGLDGDEYHFYARWLREIARKDPDALYVWVYHTDANDRLIEWARRRRSYHYLGLHFANSFWVGMLTGFAIAWVVNNPVQWAWSQQEYATLQLVLQLSLIALSMTWAVSAFYLSRPMRRDADFMELAWSCGRLHPDFKKKVFSDEDGVVKMKLIKATQH